MHFWIFPELIVIFKKSVAVFLRVELSPKAWQEDHLSVQSKLTE